MKSGLAPDLEEFEYQRLEEFRYQIRRFLAFSEAAARELGLEPQQHMALLVIKGTPQDASPTIRRLADRLLLRHHSAVGLVDRLVSLGLVKRGQSPDDARKVLLHLTALGERTLHRLSVEHRAELEERGPKLAAALREIGRVSHRVGA